MATVLSLVAQSANGKTFNELRKVLHLDANKTKNANTFFELCQQIQKDANELHLSTHNQIYVRQEFQLNKNFRKVAETKFGAGAESVDFTKKDEIAQRINRTVEEKTMHKITNVVSPDIFDDEFLSIFLLNVISFEAKWSVPFRKCFTAKDDFFTSKTDTVSVQYMRDLRDSSYAVLDDLDATALKLDYKESAFSFVIILPNTRTGLYELETRLKDYDLAKVDDRMSTQRVDISIPKFEFDFEVHLNSLLQKVCEI